MSSSVTAPPRPARSGSLRNAPAGSDVAQHDGHITLVAWQAPHELEYRGWVLEGRRIGIMWRASPWWVGDWLLYGTAKWGELYSQAAKVTGYDAKSLRNMRYVASRFDLSLRKDNLTWSHHALLASLEPEEQREWLERAVHDRLSVADLRVELRADRRGGGEGPAARRSLAAAPYVATIRCPSCGSPVPIPAGALA